MTKSNLLFAHEKQLISFFLPSLFRKLCRYFDWIFFFVDIDQKLRIKEVNL